MELHKTIIFITCVQELSLFFFLGEILSWIGFLVLFIMAKSICCITGRDRNMFIPLAYTCSWVLMIWMEMLHYFRRLWMGKLMIWHFLGYPLQTWLLLLYFFIVCFRLVFTSIGLSFTSYISMSEYSCKSSWAWSKLRSLGMVGAEVVPRERIRIYPEDQDF